MVNVEVENTNGESAQNLLRRFTKRVQGAGILRKVRSIRYHERPESKVSRKRHTLKSLAKRKNIEELIRWGKMAERPVYQKRK